MPTNTTNLGLATYNATTDSQSKFLTFRNDTNGVNNSNMTKIDIWAGTVNNNIEDLKNQKPTILINATWISMGYYEASSSEIESYKLDMLLTLRLDKDSDGTTTIKINELPVKSLMKYGADGTLSNLEVGDLRIHHEYSFRYDGTSFVWQGGTSADQMNIVGNSGEIVAIASDKTLETSGVALADVVMKSQIKNNLTETTDGNILDASQGKILDNKIGVLNEQINVLSTSCIKDKKIAFLSDSITQATYTENSYVNLIQNETGCIPLNYGISGSGYGDGTTQPAYTRLDFDVTPDIVIVFLGTNDQAADNLPLGSIGDVGLTTLSGAIFNTLGGLQNRYWDKKIGVITPIPRHNQWGLFSTANTKGYTLAQEVDIIKKNCDSLSIPILDLYYQSGMLPWNPNYNTTYFYNADGVHPNDLGHEILAKKIQPFIESL